MKIYVPFTPHHKTQSVRAVRYEVELRNELTTIRIFQPRSPVEDSLLTS
jgi:hypothetical protein